MKFAIEIPVTVHEPDYVWRGEVLTIELEAASKRLALHRLQSALEKLLKEAE